MGKMTKEQRYHFWVAAGTTAGWMIIPTSILLAFLIYKLK